MLRRMAKKKTSVRWNDGAIAFACNDLPALVVKEQAGADANISR